MGWGPPDCIPALMARGLRLRLICPCGHVAEPDLSELRRALNMLGGYHLVLASLNENLRCSVCGAKAFVTKLSTHQRQHDESYKSQALMRTNFSSVLGRWRKLGQNTRARRAIATRSRVPNGGIILGGEFPHLGSAGHGEPCPALLHMPRLDQREKRPVLKKPFRSMLPREHAPCHSKRAHGRGVVSADLARLFGESHRSKGALGTCAARRALASPRNRHAPTGLSHQHSDCLSLIRRMRMGE